MGTTVQSAYVSRAFPSCTRSILTEIHYVTPVLITKLRMETPGQVAAACGGSGSGVDTAASAAAVYSALCAAWGVPEPPTRTQLPPTAKRGGQPRGQ
eukprot:COSAG01_NODE_5256_length_4381_cov_2.177487_2_plen_97_part_00